MLDLSTFSANEEMTFIYLVQVGWLPLILEGLNDILSPSFQVNNGYEYLLFIVVREAEHSGRALVL
jgi:hypothetical protein